MKEQFGRSGTLTRICLSFVLVAILYCIGGCAIHNTNLSINNREPSAFEPIMVPNATKHNKTPLGTEHKHQYYLKDTIELNCETGGYDIYSCFSCGDVYTSNHGSPGNHVYGDWTIMVAPTCTQPGRERRSCIHCEVTEYRNVEASGHDYISATVQPTCTQRGYTTYVCDCGESYTADHTETIPHVYSSWKTIKDPTTSATGIRSRVCKNCCKVDKEIIPKKTPIDLTTIQPTNLFKGLPEKTQPIVEAILSAIQEDFEQGAESSVKQIDVYGTHNLSYNDYVEMVSYFCMYFGAYYEPWQMISLYTGEYEKVEIDVEIARELEKDRRAMMHEIEKIVSDFEDASDEALVQQTCAYIVNRFSYKAKQGDATEAIATNEGNCNAYSILFRMMLHRLGIETDICIGYTSSGAYHAWNRVTFSDGQQKYYDLTFYETTQKTKYLGATSSFHNLKSINCYLQG